MPLGLVRKHMLGIYSGKKDLPVTHNLVAPFAMAANIDANPMGPEIG